MSPEELAAIAARAAAATEGPWRFVPARDGLPAGVVSGDRMIADLDESTADADFIAHARTDVPALLAKVELLREICAMWKREHAAIAQQRDEARAALADVTRERDEARGERPSGFWSQRQWEDWSNNLALLVPEEYEDDVAQEAIIERALADLASRGRERDDLRARVEEVAKGLHASGWNVGPVFAKRLRRALLDTTPAEEE